MLRNLIRNLSSSFFSAFHWAVVFIFLLSWVSASGQYWAKKQSGPNVDETLAVSGDAEGNTYTTGYFSSTAEIDGITKGVMGLTDVFISKISPQGNTVWVVTAGGTASERGLDIAVDIQSNVIVTGFYSGTMYFGDDVSLESNNNSQDAFVAKYNSSGQILWAKSGGSSGNSDRANGVAVDSDGNVFITGQFSGDADFGNYTLTSQGTGTDVFIVKYDADGNELWAKQGSGDNANRGIAITTDDNGGVYTVGQFSNNITFDNLYPNNILNAIFIIKFSNDGNEEWFRFAGGSQQSIANGVVSDGTNLYLTGDFGSTISFLGSGISTLNSGYDHAMFIASYSESGDLLWTESQGSSSPVSVRDISVRGDQIALAGWHECTFESLSEIYGESTFNSLGYKDAFVMRYKTNGEFVYARNFGSRKNEFATGVHIQTDDKEVITGVFQTRLIVPMGDSPVMGLSLLEVADNSGYCGDPNYGKFGLMTSNSNYIEDGFTIKAIDPERSPFDIYRREGQGCDLSIPQHCISTENPLESPFCENEDFGGCAPITLYAHNFVAQSSSIGYFPNYSWSTGAGGYNLEVNEPGPISVTITSEDECYSATETVMINAVPAPPQPLLSDSKGINTQSPYPFIIMLCPGETVDLWIDIPDGYSYYWQGPGITGTPQENELNITAENPGFYTFTLAQPNTECKTAVGVAVGFQPPPPDDVKPYIDFGTESDTLSVCQSKTLMFTVRDSITQSVIFSGHSYQWSMSPATGQIVNNPLNVAIESSFQESGWYIYTLNIQTIPNPCYLDYKTYSVTDSIYIVVRPDPEIEFTMTGPVNSCGYDTITLYTSYSGGVPTYNFEVLQDFGDSLYVMGAGNYSGFLSVTNEYGCKSSISQSVIIQSVSSPVATIQSPTGVICPGDSVLISVTTQQGFITWKGPDGNLGNSSSIYVSTAGLYYAEVLYGHSCSLVSNTLEVVEFATPFLDGNNSGVLCEGDSLEISVVSTFADNIEWQPPLSGSGEVQIVTEPGIYTAQVIGCGIVFEISIEVVLNTNTLHIEQPDETPVCVEDSILLAAVPSDYSYYHWLPGVYGDSSQIYVYENGNYQVEAIDPNGCKLVSELFLASFEPLPPQPFFEYDLACEGDTMMIQVFDSLSVSYTDGLNGPIIHTNSVFVIPEFYGDTTIYAFLSSAYCDGKPGSITLSPKPIPELPILHSNAPVCIGNSLTLSVINEESGAGYFWLSPNGEALYGSATNHLVQNMNDQGTYFCVAALNDCYSDTAQIYIPLFDPRKVVLPPDTALCFTPDFKIMPTEEFSDYTWHDGSTNSWFSPTETSSLFLTVTDENGCKSSAGMEITLADCNVRIPNVFTPNGDGKNDTWIALTDSPVFYSVKVYNRWGSMVFESGSVNHVWDGTHYKTGKPCLEGVYFYIVEFSNFEGKPVSQTGNVTLIRD